MSLNFIGRLLLAVTLAIVLTPREVHLATRSDITLGVTVPEFSSPIFQNALLIVFDKHLRDVREFITITIFSHYSTIVIGISCICCRNDFTCIYRWIFALMAI